MESAENAEELAADRQSRRAVARFGVDEDAQLVLVSHGSTAACRIVDLSLSGCRVRTKERFPGSAKLRVEVSFKVRGFAFRFGGIIQWTDGRNLAGIRFVDIPARRKQDLEDVLSEVEAEVVAKAASETAAKQIAERQAAAKRFVPQAGRVLVAEPRAEETPQQSRNPVALPARPPEVEAGAQASLKLIGRDRRVAIREAVNTSATIHLINIGSRLPGRILDLSLDGCRICTDDCFPVGIYTRIEVEFQLEGLPFRLGGVIQAIHDRERRSIGIRFVDMSDRRRKQVEQLIEEIQQEREQETETRD